MLRKQAPKGTKLESTTRQALERERPSRGRAHQINCSENRLPRAPNCFRFARSAEACFGVGLAERGTSPCFHVLPRASLRLPVLPCASLCFCVLLCVLLCARHSLCFCRCKDTISPRDLPGTCRVTSQAGLLNSLERAPQLSGKGVFERRSRQIPSPLASFGKMRVCAICVQPMCLSVRL